MVTWNADAYAQSSSEQRRWARELIGKLHLRGDETLLDLGCGDGKVTAEIAAHLPGGRAVGIDSAPDMIRFARQRYGNIANLEFQQMDASHLRLTRRFDVVFSNAALHWIKDHGPVLRGIAAALRDGGRALLQMGGRGNAQQMLQIVNQLVQQPEWSAHFRDFTFPYGFHGPEEYRQWLIAARLRPVRVELIPRMMQHAGPEALAGWLRSTWMPWTDRVPPALRERFVGQVVEAYTATHPPDRSGAIGVPMVRLEVESARDAASGVTTG